GQVGSRNTSNSLGPWPQTSGSARHSFCVTSHLVWLAARAVPWAAVVLSIAAVGTPRGGNASAAARSVGQAAGKVNRGPAERSTANGVAGFPWCHRWPEIPAVLPPP